ncbi:uncharacterized protein Sap-r [Plodia interpunctella]|uniref:uncharacterized protein Sap-r n=1 Tax=Plodia interpunctella TaxID=58824 RepID=UPI002367F42A|nr:uncharacterized protein LOC128676359 [Plodia interpunctella]XP_053612404.1 uncharacterized protein LOC128676359 [Plodia interpunctella]
MANTFAVCLLILFGTNLSLARQVPKECSKGPEYWCQSLKIGAQCGAVGHCIGTVWETKLAKVRHNEVASTFIRLFQELKDMQDMINEEYLGLRVESACHDMPDAAITQICKDNTASLQQYLFKVLQSDTSPDVMCQVIRMCDNDKIDSFLAKKNKKAVIKPKKPTEHLLGGKQCTWGPSYWCSNFSTGRECHATSHCVTKVWPTMTFPEDTDSICKICTDMVQQARDQLLSNETQEELKEVFEGSCKLIPIKIVTKECIKLADDFVPELVETLSSQMNPQQVCSVAGLCNNVRIDQLLERYNTQLQLRASCDNCHSTVSVMRRKFEQTSYDDLLVNLLQVCGKMDSLSDSCSMLVFKYFENIVSGLKEGLTPQGVCHMSGQCAYKFHTHDEFTFPVMTGTVKYEDDVPCEFCEQMVIHLRDVLVANTTETEFYRVLTGLCKQTGTFKSECLHLAEQYYPTIYKYLVSDLQPEKLCTMMGICGKKQGQPEVPIAPLLPKELAITAVKRAEKSQIGRVSVANKQTSVRVLGAASAALPVERMFARLPRGASCSFCQYFLHYLQVELSDERTEDAIKAAVDKACDRLPNSVEGECKQFVTEYGPAVIALLVQEIDPASICPALGLCPQTEAVRRVTINSESSNCPLCLFAVEQLQTMLKKNSTEAEVRQALDKLCTHLSKKFQTQCTDFVDTYSEQLVEMLIADMNAQEICVFLKLCKDDTKHVDPLRVTSQTIDSYHSEPHRMADRNNRKIPMLPKSMLEKEAGGDIETNEIPDDTVNGRPVGDVSQKTVCVVCEFVMKEIDDQIKDKHNEDEIKKIVHNVCQRMPKSVRSECDQFVEKYAELVISLLAQDLEPTQVCTELKLCQPTDLAAVREEILDCAVCEVVVMAVKKVLNNDKVDRNIVHVVERACGLLPAKYSTRCHTMMEIYGDSVIHLIEEFGAKGACHKIGLCVGPVQSLRLRF